MNTFHLSVITPERTFFEGDVESLVVVTTDGEYAIMAHHAPVAVTVRECEIRIRQDGEVKRAAASAGFATVTPEETILMLQTCEWPEDIDLKRAEEDAYEAQERMRQRQSQIEYTLARSMLARARVRLKVGGKRQINDL